LITIAQSAGIDFTPDPKVMRDDEDEVARAERNLINFMNEVNLINFHVIIHFRNNMDGVSNRTMGPPLMGKEAMMEIIPILEEELGHMVAEEAVDQPYPAINHLIHPPDSLLPIMLLRHHLHTLIIQMHILLQILLRHRHLIQCNR
jgi:hypothetical protein